MQRDFLLLLHPVTNKELILLAPQDMTVHDLEVTPWGNPCNRHRSLIFIRPASSKGYIYLGSDFIFSSR